MLGCLSWLMTDISRRNRSIADRVAALSGTISLRATIRPGLVVPGLEDDPHPAPAELADRRCKSGRAGARWRPRPGRGRRATGSSRRSRRRRRWPRRPRRGLDAAAGAGEDGRRPGPSGDRRASSAPTSPSTPRRPRSGSTKTLCPAAILSPGLSRTRSTCLSLTNVPLVLPRSRSSQRGGLTSTRKWSRERAESSGIGQWTNRDRPTMNVSWRSKTNDWPLLGPWTTSKMTRIISPGRTLRRAEGLLSNLRSRRPTRTGGRPRNPSEKLSGWPSRGGPGRPCQVRSAAREESLGMTGATASRVTWTPAVVNLQYRGTTGVSVGRPEALALPRRWRPRPVDARRRTPATNPPSAAATAR